MGIVSPKLIFANMQFADCRQAISYLADQLHQTDYVKASFKASILKREEAFPTGLPVGENAVAIPHTDWQNVNRSTIAVATLTKPVLFRNMAAKQQTLHVRIIIMLAINHPHGQVKLLSRVMQLVQNKEHLDRLLSYKTKKALYEDFDQEFAGLQLET